MSKIAISNKVVGVTRSGHQRLNKYTDEELAAFVERCQDQPALWHVMFRHTSLAGARQKKYTIDHDPRFSVLPLEYRPIEPPPGLVDTAAYNVGGYVVAKYSRVKFRTRTKTEYFLDCADLKDEQMVKLLDAITNGTVFKIPDSAMSIGIGPLNDDPAEVFDPPALDVGSADEKETADQKADRDYAEQQYEATETALGSDARLEGEDDEVF